MTGRGLLFCRCGSGWSLRKPTPCLRCHPANPASGSEEGELCASSSIPIRTLIPRAEQRGKKARYEYVGPFIGDKNRYS